MISSTPNPPFFPAISLFTGAGGLDIGLERAGFEVVSSVEIDKMCCETLAFNQAQKLKIHNKAHSFAAFHLQDTQIINQDIKTIHPQALAPTDTQVACLFGGPPCQTFSSAGKRQSVFDERGTLFQEFVRMVDYWKPTTFLFENVRGLVTARGFDGKPGGVIKNILKAFENLGYSCRAGLLNAADYGAYQRRVRCFIMGVRYGLAPVFPEVTHVDLSTHSIENTVLFPELEKKQWQSLGHFLENHADNNEMNWVYPSSVLFEQLKNIPEGSGLKSQGVVEKTRPGGHWGYRQGTFIADPKKPARTITGSTAQDWIRLNDGRLRRLTFLEIKSLQGFPEQWHFCGSKAQQFKQVGNAVPLIFGERIGQTLIEYLKNYNPKLKPEKIGLPERFEQYITYTKKEEAKNGKLRKRTRLSRQSVNHDL
jgi:DNA (cytosine-5)-methyltransferase 1